MNDDFYPDEEQEQDSQNSSSGGSEGVTADDIQNVRDKARNAKNKYNEYKGNSTPQTETTGSNKFNQDLRAKNASRAGQTVGQAGEEATKNATKGATKGAAQQAGKEAAKKGTQEVAKAGAKTGAKAAAHTAAGAASTTGVGAVVGAGIEVVMAAHDIAKKAENKSIEKEAQKRDVDQETVKKERKKKKRIRRILFFLAPFLIFILLITLIMYIKTDRMTLDLKSLIERREKRNDKPLILFNAFQRGDLLFQDYDLIIDDTKITTEYMTLKKGDFKDPSYRTLLGYQGNEFIDDFAGYSSKDDPDDPVTSQDDEAIDEDNIYGKESDEIKNMPNNEKVGLLNVNRYLKAERDNFNKVNWASLASNYSYSSGNSIENDVKPSLSGSNIMNSIIADWTIPGSEVKVPSVKTYDIDPGTDDNKQKAMLYVDMLNPYMQKWIVPYAIVAETGNTKFANKYVMQYMYHKTNVTLYEIKRDTKKTTINYYLQTRLKRVVKWSTSTTTTYPDGSSSSSDGSSGEYTVDEGISNTRDSGVGVIDRKSYSNSSSDSTDVGGGSKITTSRTTHYYEELISEVGNPPTIATGADGKPMIASTKVDRNINPFKYVPKLTYCESLFEIIKADYSISPIDESTPPKSSETTDLIYGGSTTAYTIQTEVWDESLTSGNYESKPYKLSYFSPDDYKNIGRPITRIEWVEDWGDYSPTGEKAEKNNNEMYPVKSNTEKKETYNLFAKKKNVLGYDDMIFAMEKLTEHYFANNANSPGNTVDIGSIPEGGFLWPVEDVENIPNAANVTATLGPYDFGTHYGIDIANGGKLERDGSLTKGPYIIAAAGGKVVSSKSTTRVDGSASTPANQGNYVCIETADKGLYMYYYHLSDVYVKTGDTVTIGQRLGRMGTTGHSSGVHLHFEWHTKPNRIDSSDSLVDPLLYYNMSPEYMGPSQSIRYKYVSPKSSDFNTGASGGNSTAKGNIVLKNGVTLTGEMATLQPRLAKYSSYISKYSKQNNLPTMWIVAIIAEESRFIPDAEGTGAYGLMQLQYTGKGNYGDQGYTIQQLIDPETNIRLGTAHLGGIYAASGNNIWEALGRYGRGTAGWKKIKEKAGISGNVTTYEEAKRALEVSNDVNFIYKMKDWYDKYSTYYEIKE